MNLNIRISIFEFGYYKFLHNKDPAQGEYKDVVLSQSQKSWDCWWSCKCCNVWQTLSNTHSDLPGSRRSFIRISVSSLSLLAFLLAISALKWEHEPPGWGLRVPLTVPEFPRYIPATVCGPDGYLPPPVQPGPHQPGQPSGPASRLWTWGVLAGCETVTWQDQCDSSARLWKYWYNYHSMTASQTKFPTS